MFVHYSKWGAPLRLWALADMCSALGDVRYVPIADIEPFRRGLNLQP